MTTLRTAVGLRQFLKETFLFEPSPAQLDLGQKAVRGTVVFPGTTPTSGRGTNRLRLLSAQGGATDYARATDSGRLRDYRAYLNAITVPSVYKACSVIASNFASCELRVFNDDDEQVDIKSELPGFYNLLKHPNSEVDGFTFLEFLAYDLELTGNAVFALDSWNGRGEPTEMFRLRPDLLRIRRQDDGTLQYFYDVSGPGLSTATTVVYDADEIVHFKYANPKDPLWGLGVIEGAELLVSIDRRVNEFKLGYFDRGGILDGVLTTPDDMDDTEYNRLLTKWKSMKDGAGKGQIKTAILWAGAQYEPIQEPLGSVPIVELSKMSRNDVLEAFGVPPSKVGDVAGINYNNANQADQFFWAETMQPILRKVEPGWDKLLSYFGDNYYAGYLDYSLTDYKTRAETAFALAQTGAFTRNDIRVAAGYDPLDPDDPLGDVFLGSTRQALFPGEYDEALDYLPMTPARLLGLEEDRVRAEHERALSQPKQFGGYTPGAGWMPGPSGGPSQNGGGAASLASGSAPPAQNGNGKQPPPSQRNRGARPTPPSAATRSGIGRSSTGRKSASYSYPQGLLYKETRERMRREEREERERRRGE